MDLDALKDEKKIFFGLQDLIKILLKFTTLQKEKTFHMISKNPLEKQ